LDGTIASVDLLNAFAFDHGVFNEQVVIYVAAVEIAGAFDCYAFTYAHGVFVAAGHDDARFNATLSADL
jgi:hypothetical protein